MFRKNQILLTVIIREMEVIYDRWKNKYLMHVDVHIVMHIELVSQFGLQVSTLKHCREKNRWEEGLEEEVAED
jgi:hypothetical protein